jgi:hypothetical protein
MRDLVRLIVWDGRRSAEEGTRRRFPSLAAALASLWSPSLDLARHRRIAVSLRDRDFIPRPSNNLAARIRTPLPRPSRPGGCGCTARRSTPASHRTRRCDSSRVAESPLSDHYFFRCHGWNAGGAVLVGDARTTVGKIDGIGAARDMPIATTTLPIKARTPVEGLDPSSDS